MFKNIHLEIILNYFAFFCTQGVALLIQGAIVTPKSRETQSTWPDLTDSQSRLETTRDQPAGKAKWETQTPQQIKNHFSI